MKNYFKNAHIFGKFYLFLTHLKKQKKTVIAMVMVMVIFTCFKLHINFSSA